MSGTKAGRFLVVTVVSLLLTSSLTPAQKVDRTAAPHVEIGDVRIALRESATDVRARLRHDFAVTEMDGGYGVRSRLGMRADPA